MFRGSDTYSSNAAHVIVISRAACRLAVAYLEILRQYMTAKADRQDFCVSWKVLAEIVNGRRHWKWWRVNTALFYFGVYFFARSEMRWASDAPLVLAQSERIRGCQKVSHSRNDFFLLWAAQRIEETSQPTECDYQSDIYESFRVCADRFSQELVARKIRVGKVELDLELHLLLAFLVQARDRAYGCIHVDSSWAR